MGNACGLDGLQGPTNAPALPFWSSFFFFFFFFGRSSLFLPLSIHIRIRPRWLRSTVETSGRSVWMVFCLAATRQMSGSLGRPRNPAPAQSYSFWQVFPRCKVLFGGVTKFATRPLFSFLDAYNGVCFAQSFSNEGEKMKKPNATATANLRRKGQRLAPNHWGPFPFAPLPLRRAGRFVCVSSRLLRPLSAGIFPARSRIGQAQCQLGHRRPAQQSAAPIVSLITCRSSPP